VAHGYDKQVYHFSEVHKIAIDKYLAIINTLNYQKILEIFLNCPTLNSNPMIIKILIISGTPIWVIFQNSVTKLIINSRDLK